MSTPYSDTTANLKALWTARWAPPSPPVPVIWQDNGGAPLPSRATTNNWLHLSVDFEMDELRAFGGGVGQSERELSGTITVLSMSAVGAGEDRALELLDAALNVFRSQTHGSTKILGASPLKVRAERNDGGWHIRAGVAHFVTRFIG